MQEGLPGQAHLKGQGVVISPCAVHAICSLS